MKKGEGRFLPFKDTMRRVFPTFPPSFYLQTKGRKEKKKENNLGRVVGADGYMKRGKFWIKLFSLIIKQSLIQKRQNWFHSTQNFFLLILV